MDIEKVLQGKHTIKGSYVRRKLIVCNIMSLDGYFTGPNNDVTLLPVRAPGFDAYNAERLRAADTLLLGRVSFDGFNGYWSPMKDDPTATEVSKEISRLNGAMPKVVISDTLTDDQTALWTNTTIVKRADAYKRVDSIPAVAKPLLLWQNDLPWLRRTTTRVVSTAMRYFY